MMSLERNSRSGFTPVVSVRLLSTFSREDLPLELAWIVVGSQLELGFVRGFSEAFNALRWVQCPCIRGSRQWASYIVNTVLYRTRARISTCAATNCSSNGLSYNIVVCLISAIIASVKLYRRMESPYDFVWEFRSDLAMLATGSPPLNFAWVYPIGFGQNCLSPGSTYIFRRTRISWVDPQSSM